MAHQCLRRRQFGQRIILVAALSSAFATFAAESQEQARGANSQRVLAGTLSDQLIVRYLDGTPGAMVDDEQTIAPLHAVAAHHGTQLRALRRDANNALVFKLDRFLADDALLALAGEIREADATVQYAEPDRIKHAALTPNDPAYPSQWHYYEGVAGISMPSAWNLTSGAGVVVSVIDTGYRRHADLAANIVGGYDFISDVAMAGDGDGRDASALDPGDWVKAGDCGDGSQAHDSSWHGTHVAGTVAAVTNNGAGVAGVAFGAKVLPVRVLGKCGGYDSDIADGMVWAAGGSVPGVPANLRPAKVLNLSLGGYGDCSATYTAAINSARARGAVVVVAAGNSNDDAALYAPANCAGVITVGAMGRTGAQSSYSNYGPALQIAAPGGDFGDGILSTLNDGAHGPGNDIYANLQGTSMAAPHVAGVAALMFSRNPSITPNQLLARMRSNAKLFPFGGCSGCGAGIVDAYWSAYMALATMVAEKENNGSMATAQAVTPAAAVVSGTVGTVGDLDYYRVALPVGKTLRASLAPTATTRDFDMYLLDAAGGPLRKSERSFGQTDRITYTNTGTSTMDLYIEIVHYAGGAGTYTLSFAR